MWNRISDVGRTPWSASDPPVALSLAWARILRALLLFAAGALLLGQGENDPYFALSTNATFASNGKPTISMSAWNVQSLEFRIYRINDPVKFFEQVEDPHQFGMSSPTPRRERTLLEKIHDWKHSLRTEIRSSLRAQFTESPSAHMESVLPHAAPKPVPAGPKGTHFAEAPLLNPDQLVLAFVQPVAAHTRWERETVGIDVKDKGVYLVEAVGSQLRAYTILMVSDMVLITKAANGHVVNLAVDRSTGQPLANVAVSYLTRNDSLSTATTNNDGIAEWKLPATNGLDVRIVARNGRDFGVNSVAGAAPGADDGEWTGYLYTDRPVYRPGHTVHFRGIVRLRNATGYQVPVGRKLNVEIDDAEQKPLYQKTLTTTDSGVIHDEITLSKGATLGNYFIQVKAGDNFMSGNFEVQEYKKPEYEVRVTPAQGRVLEGAKVPITINARYYFGEPVNGAKVTYSVYRQRYWFPIWFDPDEDTGDAQQQQDDDSSGDQINEQEAKLDADGNLKIEIPTAVSEHHMDYLYRVDAHVTDAADREILGTGWIVATYGSFLLNILPDRYFYAPGSQATFQIEARDYDNKPVNQHAHVELLQWNFRDPEKSVVKAATDVDTGANGSANATFTIPGDGGQYRVRATASGPERREVEADTYLWISGSGGWDYGGNEQAITIVPDKKTYRAGETARVLIVAGKPNTAVFVTVEGREVRDYKLLRSHDATVSYEFPVGANDEPGITVSAGYVRDGIFFAGSKYIKVPPVKHKLNVQLSTDKQQYLPGQTAQYDLAVSNFDGKPVPRAEFSLGVVDEAIYAIRKDTTPEIVSFFFGQEWNRVNTQSSLEYYFSGEAGKRRMRLAELRAPSRLAQLKPERLVEPKIRKVFPDTAFWSADLVTDASGHARTKVDFPDSLTTWRATARGATASTEVGSATLKTIVRKNLILRLAVPRFFVQGDEVAVSALVHNYLPDTKTVRVSLDVKGLDVLDGATKDLQIPSRGEVKVDWRVRAQQVRTATLIGKALTDQESDAMELELPVNIAGIKLSQARGGSLTPGSSAEFDLTFPPKVQPGSRSISIRLTPSIVGSLFSAIDYLTSFPYGCVEQTMSSFLPNIIVRQAVRELGLKTNVDDSELQEKIRAGLDRLYAFHHDDGGWGWWESDESHPFMTAYVVAGLMQAQAAGIQIQRDQVQTGVDWIKKDLAANPQLPPDMRAYMAYALAVAGQSDGALLGQLYDGRSKLSPYGVALLGLALEQAKDGRAASLAGELEHTAKTSADEASWPTTRDQMLDFEEDVTPEATAFVAKFLSHEKAAVWLMNHRNEGYWWNSTKQTAMVIYGLTDYLKLSNELNPNMSVTVSVNGQTVIANVADKVVDLDESKLQPGANHIRVATTGTSGRLYYSTRADYYSNEERLQKQGSVSLNILRDYFRLVPTHDGERIVYDTVPFDGPAAVGDTLAVRLTVSGSEWKYMMLEDPIPAGTEFIERDNGYEFRDKPPWWSYYFTRRELHDDRMAIFETYFPKGQQTYFYLLKVVNPGVFQVSPARVGPMYQTDVLATTESRRLEVK
jgi:uncharacterized protein YfaS (alpha-2-macroglobulin family)